ncbi:MAG: hypothetical protein LBM65_01285 [Oscillospiraceae bacterium]|jgi:hypothetical protein|nr:hypothetical protein [Oscillospiraceae bacterium]
MYCTYCGSLMEENALVCSQCGTQNDIAENAPVQPGSQDVAQPIAQPTATVANPNVAPPAAPAANPYAAPPYGSQPTPPPYAPPAYPQYPYYPQQQGYQLPPVQPEEKPVSVGQWIGYNFLFAVPIVGLVFLFMWAFDKKINKSLSNFCRSYLIMMAIMVGLWIIAAITMIIALISISAQYGSYY